MTYELWDTEARTIVEAFDTEADALAAIRQTVAAHGRPDAEVYALVSDDANGASRTIARGAKLVDRALKVSSTAA